MDMETLSVDSSFSSHHVQGHNDDDDRKAWAHKEIELQEAIGASILPACALETPNAEALDLSPAKFARMGFLAFHPELRNRIYEYVYEVNIEYHVEHRSACSASHKPAPGAYNGPSQLRGDLIDHRSFSPPLRGAISLSLCCHQIHKETRSFLVSLAPFDHHHFYILSRQDRDVFEIIIPRILATPGTVIQVKISLVISERQYYALGFLQDLLYDNSYSGYYNYETEVDSEPEFASVRRLDVEFLNPHGAEIDSYPQFLNEMHKFARRSDYRSHPLEYSFGHMRLKDIKNEMRTMPGVVDSQMKKRTWTLTYGSTECGRVVGETEK
jgi:hypothetical protein